MHIPNNIIKSMFQNVYFITGTAYSGKSTAVKLLAERFDGICCGENYHDVFMEHIDKEHQPNLSYFETMRIGRSLSAEHLMNMPLGLTAVPKKLRV